MFRIIILLFCFFTLYAENPVYRIGKGTLEESHYGLILRLQGKPYDMGVQHGMLLRDKIHQNLETYIESPDLTEHMRYKSFEKALPKLLKYIPDHYLEEMRGLAYGADVQFEKILLLNLFPEMFHCIGMTTQNDATVDQALYHVRVLDYGVGKNLQKTAVLMVVSPEDKHAFVSVSYAGFIGCITGMNEKKIAMGEIGGDGYGNWEGIPMSFLMRIVLENAGSLDEAKQILKESSRTCEYYYVISDGNQEKAIGVYATQTQLEFIQPGTSYALLAPHAQHQEEKTLLSNFSLSSSAFQSRIHDQEGTLLSLYNHQPDHCIVLRGFGYPERYPILAERMQNVYGTITVEKIQEMLKPPVTNQTNLHNAIFRPSTLDLWVSHAGSDGTPASEQPYANFNLIDLVHNN